MKTIVIAHNYSEVSFAGMSYNLARFLANEGHRVVFISHQPYFKEIRKIKIGKNKVIVYSWPTKKRPTALKDFIWYAKIHLKYKPNVVIGHFVGSNITIMVSKFLSFGKTQTIEYYHTLSTQLKTDHHLSGLRRLFLLLRKKIFYNLFCDLLICPSSVAQKDLRKVFKISNSIVVLNPMIDRFKNKNTINDNKITISYLGRLDASKGVLDLIKAFKIYKIENRQSSIVLNIAGTGREESEIMYSINGRVDVNFIGGLDYSKVDEYLQQSDYTIIPSKFDAFNVVGVESMMNQTPLLISYTTGLAYYLEDGIECYKFKACIDDIVKMFHRVEQNHQKCKNMGVNARMKFLDKFGIDSYCEVFQKIIE